MLGILPCIPPLIITLNLFIPVNSKGKTQDTEKLKALPRWQPGAAGLGFKLPSVRLQGLNSESLPCTAPSTRASLPAQTDASALLCLPAAFVCLVGSCWALASNVLSQNHASYRQQSPVHRRAGSEQALPRAPPLYLHLLITLMLTAFTLQSKRGVAQATGTKRWDDFQLADSITISSILSPMAGAWCIIAGVGGHQHIPSAPRKPRE